MAGKPHQAWGIIQDHDPSLWRGFQRGMLEHARERYTRTMGIHP